VRRPSNKITRRAAILAVAGVSALATSLTGLAAQASAGTIAVSNLNDSGPGSLRAAITGAASGETITVPAGQITLASTLSFSKSLTIDGAGAGATVISGNGAVRVLTITGTPTVTLEGLTVTGGNETFGAGIRAAGTLALDGVAVSGNHAGGSGVAGFGGGIDFGPGTLSLTDSSVTANSAGGSKGAGFGGGIDFEPTENGQAMTLTLLRSSVSGNEAGASATGFGGGIDASSGLEGGSISITLTDSSLSGNVAGGSGAGSGFGGGLELSSGGNNNTLTLTRAAVNGNSAGGGAGDTGFGGGIEYSSGGSGVTQTLSATNSTIAANHAGGSGGDGFGGGIEFGTGTVTMSYSTVVDNSAGGGGGKATGGGLDVQSTATVGSSIFAANSGGNCASALTSARDNVDDGASCGFTAAGDHQGVEARLGPLGSYGGPTQTVMPLSGSPAIDAGNSATCPATDERGLARPQGSACDSGAFEVAPPIASTGAASAIDETSATLAGIASDPELTAGSASFQWGTTTAYGAQTSQQAISAATLGSSVSARITGLLPGTVYHFRTVALNAAGTALGADQTFTTAPLFIPVLTHLTLSPATFAAALKGPSATTARKRFGTKVAYTLNGAALVRFTVLQAQAGRMGRGRRCAKPTRANRRGRRCTRLLALHGGLTRTALAGLNTFRFTGRLGGRRLRPGSYRLLATPTSGGASGGTVSVAFRVVK
jgi:hypothetical protein